MNEYIGKLCFESQFAQELTGFIREKQGLGNKYICEMRNLWHFDKFVKENGFQENTITKEIFEAWTSKRIYERDKTGENRRNTFRQLCQYIVRSGGDAYVPPAMARLRTDRAYRPHIFTNEELQKFLDAAREMERSEKRRKVFYMLFSLLICTGMRLGEALNLEKSDISFYNGHAVISIREAKFNKERKIPLAEEMTAQFKEYLQETALLFPDSTAVFPAGHGQAYSEHEVYVTFRKALWKAGISHGGAGKGPRVHDFRHTFAVKSLRKLVLHGENIMAVMPLLCQYLGHKNTSSTQTYLQFTADMFPHVITAVESSFGEIVPRMEEE